MCNHFLGKFMCLLPNEQITVSFYHPILRFVHSQLLTCGSWLVTPATGWLSQSLLNEVWFPSATKDTMQRRYLSQSLLNEVWFPSSSNLILNRGGKSQSLLNEVWFPSKGHTVSYLNRIGSQSLLNEVWFLSLEYFWWSVYITLSQSLLNEVWFLSPWLIKSHDLIK